VTMSMTTYSRGSSRLYRTNMARSFRRHRMGVSLLRQAASFSPSLSASFLPSSNANLLTTESNNHTKSSCAVEIIIGNQRGNDRVLQYASIFTHFLHSPSANLLAKFHVQIHCSFLVWVPISSHERVICNMQNGTLVPWFFPIFHSSIFVGA